jgi:hypothetical protein
MAASIIYLFQYVPCFVIGKKLKKSIALSVWNTTSKDMKLYGKGVGPV